MVERWKLRPSWRGCAAMAGIAAALGCTSSITDPGGMNAAAQPGTGGSGSTAGANDGGTRTTMPGMAGTGTTTGTGNGGASAGMTAAGGASAGGPSTGCSGDIVTDAKRIVRLSFHQLSTTIHALLGDTLGTKIDADYEIGPESPVARTFPPLASPREGAVITTSLWTKIDQIASAAGAYVLANFDAVTGCGAAPTDACAQQFVTSFAEKVYRRPLTDADLTSITTVYSEVKATYGTIPEAVQYSVYALMQSPELLYRTELGSSKDEAGALTDYELATNLAYFLTDGPPDAALLDAAKQKQLNATELAAQANRILTTDTARKNLEGAMFSYFALDNLASVKIDDAGFTQGTAARPYTGLRESAYHEAELFFANTLWSGPVTTLLTAKRSAINSTLASFYGITLPPQTDERAFVSVDLPENRGGLLTQVAFLAANSRPDVPSVVARGLVVNKALLCAINPPFPEDAATVAQIASSKEALANATERERADFRAKTSPCSSCHLNFDAYGLALDTYDAIGRYRTTDAEGRAIDPSVTLPPTFGGAAAANAVDMEAQIANNPAFAACLAKNMLNWALAEGSQLTPDSCSTQLVVERFDATDKSFGALLREIAASPTFTTRSAGVTP